MKKLISQRRLDWGFCNVALCFILSCGFQLASYWTERGTSLRLYIVSWVFVLLMYVMMIVTERMRVARRDALSRIDDRRRRRETLKSLGHWPPVRYDERKFHGDFKWIVVPKEGAE